MAKKQTRRSISVSRTTYERLKAFCETNNISMSQLVETRVNDFLGAGDVAPAQLAPSAPARSATPMAPRGPTATATAQPAKPVELKPALPATSPTTTPAVTTPPPAPMASAAARFV